MFLCLILIARYILLFLKPFRYCINIIEYIYVIYIILEIFSRNLLINIMFIDYFGDN